MRSAAVAALSGGGLAFGQQGPQHMQDVAHKRASEATDSGGRMVQVPERALFMLGSTPGIYFHKAVEDMEKSPGKVREEIGMVANVFELEAARCDGEVKRRMIDCGKHLFQLSEKVETRQVLGKEPLEKSFAKALHTLAEIQQQQAEQGLASKDAERVGWGIRTANYDLVEALVYSKQEPSPQVSRALFDADTLGEQLIHLAKPRAAQLEARGTEDGKPQVASETQAPAGQAKRGTEPLDGTKQVQQAAMMPREAEQVVKDLGQALQTTEQQITAMKD